MRIATSSDNPLSKKKIILIISIFILILMSIRLIWLYYTQIPEHPHAEDGIVDLQDWQFTDDQVITLDGEWEFYPNKPLDPTEDKSNYDHTALSVPSKWQDELSEENFGTYRLKILLPENTDQLYGIRATNITTSSRIYINNELIAESGTVASSPEGYQGSLKSYTGFLNSDSSEIELMIQVTNYNPTYSGGLERSLKFGTNVAVSDSVNANTIFQLLVSAIFLLHAIYALSLFLLGMRRKELVYYSFLLFL